MPKARTRYGIKVVRWVWDKPGPQYRYVTQHISAYRKAVDWSNFELALF